MIFYYPVLTIAGSDSSGGAGIQADIKTIAAQGCYAMSAITAVTAQNTMGVESVWPLPHEAVGAQILAITRDIEPLAVKTGMLHNAAIVEVVAEAIRACGLQRVVVDPVMVSTSGCLLLEEDAVEAMRTSLLPAADLVTPNYAEAVVLTGEHSPEAQAEALRAMGCRNILIKGGDVDNGDDRKTDFLLLEDSTRLQPLSADAIDTVNTHGTGCTLSAAIASRLALGDDVATAVSRAKLYVTRAIEAGANICLGHGHGPLNHSFEPKKMKIRHQ